MLGKYDQNIELMKSIINLTKIFLIEINHHRTKLWLNFNMSPSTKSKKNDQKQIWITVEDLLLVVINYYLFYNWYTKQTTLICH